eukprot:793439-Prymnesium_polylepis.1
MYFTGMRGSLSRMRDTAPGLMLSSSRTSMHTPAVEGIRGGDVEHRVLVTLDLELLSHTTVRMERARGGWVRVEVVRRGR